MKLISNKRLNMNISPTTAGAAIALVLLASVVGSREAPVARVPVAEPTVVEPTVAGPGESPGARAVPPGVETAALDVDKLRRSSGENKPGDLFAARTVAGSAPAALPQAAEPAAAPAAPPLPFRYLGKLIQSDGLRIFLGNGESLYTVTSGQTLENLYKVELVTEEMVTFTFIPLGTRQTLAITAPS